MKTASRKSKLPGIHRVFLIATIASGGGAFIWACGNNTFSADNPDDAGNDASTSPDTSTPSTDGAPSGNTDGSSGVDGGIPRDGSVSVFDAAPGCDAGIVDSGLTLVCPNEDGGTAIRCKDTGLNMECCVMADVQSVCQSTAGLACAGTSIQCVSAATCGAGLPDVTNTACCATIDATHTGLNTCPRALVVSSTNCEGSCGGTQVTMCQADSDCPGTSPTCVPVDMSVAGGAHAVRAGVCRP